MTTETNSLLAQGRIVWTTGSNLFEGKQKKDYNTGVPVMNANNEPVIEYGFGLAIPKIDPATGQHSAEFTKIWEALHKEAFTLFPTGQLPPDFAMKFKDGDTAIDDKGVPYSKREGYAGHIVLACTTRIAIKYFVFEGGNNILVSTGIKCGDYVNVQLNIKAHPAKGRGKAGKAGLYLNPSAVQLIQAGAAIINTPSGDQIFGTTGPQAYQGQVVADTAPQMPNVAPNTAPAMPQAAPVAPQVPQQAPANYGVLPPAHQPQQAPAAPQIPAQQAYPGAPAPNGMPAGVPASAPVAPPAPVINAPQGQVSNGMPAMPGVPAPQ